MARFNPTRRAPLWPPAGTPEWPHLAPLPELPACPIRLDTCRVGDRVLLVDGTEAEILSVGSLGVRLRPFTSTTRVVEDSRAGVTRTFEVRRPAYTIASSATAQAVVGRVPW
jgi:hypothetical protein